MTMATEDLDRWLDEQIERERCKLAAADDPEDAAFFDGLIDGFKLVKRKLGENDPFGPVIESAGCAVCGHLDGLFLLEAGPDGVDESRHAWASLPTYTQAPSHPSPTDGASA